MRGNGSYNERLLRSIDHCWSLSIIWYLRSVTSLTSEITQVAPVRFPD